jgi:methyl-accepting chemotaxis protein
MLNNLTIKTRLYSLIGLMSLLAILLSFGGLYGMKKANDGLKTVYLDRTIPLATLAVVKEKLLHNRTALITSFSFPEEMAGQHKKIEENIEKISQLWAEYMATYLTPEEKILADKFATDREIFVAAVKKSMALQRGDNQEEAKKFYFETARSSYKPAYEGIEALIQLQKDVAKQEYETIEEHYKFSVITSILALVVGLLLAVFVGIKIINQLMANVGGEPAYVAELVRQISNGDLSAKVTLLPNDKSSLLHSVSRMRDALNNAIISINITMSEIAQGDLNSRITGDFKGDFVQLKTGMNTSLDTINETLNNVMRVTNAISNGDLKQKITGNYSGAFGKTKDSVNQTVDALNKLVDEIDGIVYSGADCGDFSVKISMHDKVGYGKRLAELINQLFSVTEKSLSDVLRVSEALAKGDLTQTIDADYVGAFAATKAGMNSTVENLKSLIGEIKATSEVIASASNEISAGNNDLSHRTEEQASSLQQTAASMEKLSATVQQNTDNAKQANQLAEGASTTAKQGVKVVNDVVKTMATINESSHKIVDIITVIDDIAFQTNILALNAAVEAARAGESGKGFAVVAVEVRSLAQRAANAAGEIKRLIDNSVESISNGSKQVEQAGKTMEDIVGAIQNVTTIMSEIAAASIQQNAGINQVHQAVTQMDGVTQQNATLVEEAAAAAESLSQQTRNLAMEMAHFKTR